MTEALELLEFYLVVDVDREVGPGTRCGRVRSEADDAGQAGGAQAAKFA